MARAAVAIGGRRARAGGGPPATPLGARKGGAVPSLTDSVGGGGGRAEIAVHTLYRPAARPDPMLSA
jgi:hypothetical protein